MEFTLLLFGPALLTVGAALLLYRGLRAQGRVLWASLLAGLALLVLVCGWLVKLTVSDHWGGGIVAFIEVLLAVGPAFGAGLWLLGSLQGWRKLAGLLVGLIFPLALFVSLSTSSNYSPSALREKNGESIARALVQYRVDQGTYPETLGELVPEYIDQIRDPETVWGWLYKVKADEFILGYVDWVQDPGYGFRVYRSTEPGWDRADCRFSNRAICPFNLGPTPAPTFVPTRGP